MSTISLTSSKPAAGALARVYAAFGQAFASRRAAAAFAAMSEREFQDVGWGQLDRYAANPLSHETPPERRARLAAVSAWHRAPRKAA